MTVTGWLVRYDGTPTTGARVVGSLVVLAAFLGGFAARSHGEKTKAQRPAPALVGRLAADATPVRAASVRLSAAAAVPTLRPAPRKHRRAARAGQPATLVSEPAAPAPDATPDSAKLVKAEATPEAAPVPAAPKPAPAPAAPAPAPRPAPKPAAPKPKPGPVFDSSG